MMRILNISGGHMSYYFKDDHFIIEDYDKKKTFSSFLPGIAGVKGIPLWAFYANRGQGITSFGIRDKDEPILEFFPANTAYQYVDTYGFRSFVRIDGKVYEPFAVHKTGDIKRTMTISRGHFSIEEVNQTHKIAYKVTYFGLSNEPVAGLVRKVEVRNFGQARQIDIVDGIATILPSGATNASYKEMSNLMRSWMAVENTDNQIPFYKFRASSGDEAEVTVENKGHFYMSFVNDSELIQPIIDINLIFDYDTSLSVPVGLEVNDFKFENLNHQVVVNKIPCGFTPVSQNIDANQTLTINTIIGHVSDMEIINTLKNKFATKDFVNSKFIQAEQTIDEYVDVIETETSFPIFDAYLKQCFLDNMLRGGYPLVLGEGNDKKIYHVFSRKHGDPERDYNFFKLEPEFYSQGNGNFRDVNQNRRNDVFFVPEAGLYNIKTFMSLIQLDGYNPLGVKGTTFTIKTKYTNDLLSTYVVGQHKKLSSLLSGKFTPGMISMAISLQEIELNITEEDFIDKVMSLADQHIEANFGEGFWVDHWTYNFDLIESYLSIYPDKVRALLFDDKTYKYYESPVSVLPRHMKYGLTQTGEIRQYGSILEEEHSKRFDQSNWIQTQAGKTYETNLAQKLFTLVLTKYSSLDPFGMGIEMEANKPGWNDAMNGLPGVFGSGLSESIELVRVVDFLRCNLHEDITLLEENYDFMITLEAIMGDDKSSFELWDARSTARENFREKIISGVEGVEKRVSIERAKKFLDGVYDKLMAGIHKAKESNKGIVPTFIAYQAVAYKELGSQTAYGLPAVQVNAFEQVRIPDFLEAPARSYKIESLESNRDLYQVIKKTDIYDEVLRTYKTSDKLNEMSYELGRVRAFTPGWLERESNFLHMTYKYILGLLKGGLYDAFYEEIDTNLVCFMNPEIYGRSILENSSFIASSFNPDSKVHGQGFVARLSGSTAEMLSIWQMMMYGKNLFIYNDKLVFNPKPILHERFFKDGRVKTSLLSDIEFIIENRTGYSTYSDQVDLDYYLVDGDKVYEITGDLAEKVRSKKVKQVIMVYKIRS